MTQNLQDIRHFILGGRAIFTIVSKKSGDRRTFRVRAAEDVDGSGRPHGYYIDLLIGPDNREDYRYLLYMYVDPVVGWLVCKPNKDKWGEDADRAFNWFVFQINANFDHFPTAQPNFEKNAEFHHCGYCSRCGRLLTDPESIELGIGPICREHMAPMRPTGSIQERIGLALEPGRCANCGKLIAEHGFVALKDCARVLGIEAQK